MTFEEKEQLFHQLLRLMGSPLLSEDGESLTMHLSQQRLWGEFQKRELFLDCERKGLNLVLTLRVFTKDDKGKLQQERK